MIMMSNPGSGLHEMRSGGLLTSVSTPWATNENISERRKTMHIAACRCSSILYLGWNPTSSPELKLRGGGGTLNYYIGDKFAMCVDTSVARGKQDHTFAHDNPEYTGEGTLSCLPGAPVSSDKGEKAYVYAGSLGKHQKDEDVTQEH